MNKTKYISRMLAKTKNKIYEHYVITRIWHLLNNLDLKFITQQHVTRPTGRALTDIYFPQIRLHIEVDESHHFTADGYQVDSDIVREADIINATGDDLERIRIFEKNIESYTGPLIERSLEDINKDIDNLIDTIKNKINNLGDLPKWDIEAEYNPQTYINKGYIEVSDNVAFRTIADACNCFGHNYEGCQRAFVKHAVEQYRMLWFPKLYANKDWDNEISLDEEEIYEKKKEGHKEYFEMVTSMPDDSKTIPDNLKEQLTFARVKNNLGFIMYRFKGVYKLDRDKSISQGRIVYTRIETCVNTYKPLKSADHLSEPLISNDQLDDIFIALESESAKNAINNQHLDSTCLKLLKDWNTIPFGTPCGCKSKLLVFVSNETRMHEIIGNALVHVGSECGGVTKLALFYVSIDKDNWSKAWELFRPSFENIERIEGLKVEVKFSGQPDFEICQFCKTRKATTYKIIHDAWKDSHYKFNGNKIPACNQCASVQQDWMTFESKIR